MEFLLLLLLLLLSILKWLLMQTMLSTENCLKFQLSSTGCLYTGVYLEHEFKELIDFVELCRSSHRKCSIKKAFLKSFAIFIGKSLYWSIFSCEPYEIVKNIFFEKHR